eukprot:TRINITY_DN7277_c0_g2_i1.p1 TRINITY_DN7277_c0_g2~~TRINITY_DN7277_c0_g2_i1.p1  ORF type:complete len:341 (-),score=36.25 TRINITY_DN7277_c0_g2_i1:362-1384(-)
MERSEPSSCPVMERSRFLEALLCADPQEIIATATVAQRPRLMKWVRSMNELCDISERRSPSYVAQVLMDTSLECMPSPCGTHCFMFFSAKDLVQSRSVSTFWKKWLERDEFWRRLLEHRWPGSAAVRKLGIMQGRAIDVYRRRLRMEQCAEKDVPQQVNAKDTLLLLVEMSSGKDRIFDGLLHVSQISQRKMKAVVPTPVLVQLGKEAASIELSLTIVRRDNGRMLRICTNRRLSDYLPEPADDTEEPDSGTLSVCMGEDEDLDFVNIMKVNPLEAFVCLGGVARKQPLAAEDDDAAADDESDFPPGIWSFRSILVSSSSKAVLLAEGLLIAWIQEGMWV